MLLRKIAASLLPGKAYKVLAGFAQRLRQRRLAVKAMLFRLPPPMLRMVRRWLYPEVLSIFLTTRCNLRCFICNRHDHKGEDLQFENIYKLKNAIRYASVIDLTGWGECFLYPRFDDVLRYIFSLNGSRNLIQISTNGTLLSRSRAELLKGHIRSIVISVNAASAATYNRDMEQGDYQKTLASIRVFLAALNQSERSRVRLHFVAHRDNYHEIPDFVRLAQSVGVTSVSVGHYLVDREGREEYALLANKDGYNAAVSQAEKIGRELGVVLQARSFFSEGKEGNVKCYDPVSACFIRISGDVSPCCYCGSYSIGNVYRNDFESVWFGEEYARLRRVRHLPACKTCSPLISFDDPRAHLTAYYKEKDSQVL